MTSYKKPGAVIIEGHVQGLSNTRSLGKAGIPVIVVDKNNCIARYSKYCKKFFISPDFIKDEFAEFLIDLAEKENIRDWVLMPSNDHAVYIISKYKKKLQSYYRIITPGLPVIENIYNKMKLIDAAVEINIPVPITQSFKTIHDKIAKDLKFPVITKGSNGLSFYREVGEKALLAKNEKELRNQLNYIQSILEVSKTFTQEMIPSNGFNKPISFTAFCVDGEIKTHWTGIKLREHPIQFGTATFAKSIMIEECHKQSVPLLKKLRYTGVCEVEYLLDPRDGQYKLIEINPRTWLWVGLARACGVDYAKMIYEYVNNIDIKYPGKYKTDICWINPLTDMVYSAIAMLKGQLSPWNYIRSIVSSKKVSALWVYNDLKPGFAYLLKIFSFLRNR